MKLLNLLSNLLITMLKLSIVVDVVDSVVFEAVDCLSWLLKVLNLLILLV